MNSARSTSGRQTQSNDFLPKIFFFPSRVEDFSNRPVSYWEDHYLFCLFWIRWRANTWLPVRFYSTHETYYACNWGKTSGPPGTSTPRHIDPHRSLSVQHSKRRSTRPKRELPAAMWLSMMSLYRFVQKQLFVLFLRPRAVVVKQKIGKEDAVAANEVHFANITSPTSISVAGGRWLHQLWHLNCRNFLILHFGFATQDPFWQINAWQHAPASNRSGIKCSAVRWNAGLPNLIKYNAEEENKRCFVSRDSLCSRDGQGRNARKKTEGKVFATSAQRGIVYYNTTTDNRNSKSIGTVHEQCIPYNVTS